MSASNDFRLTFLPSYRHVTELLWYNLAVSALIVPRFGYS